MAKPAQNPGNAALLLVFSFSLCYNMCKKFIGFVDAQEVQKERRNTMTEQAAAARRAYKRKWAKENPEKVKAQQERYWQRKAEQEAAATAPPAAETPAQA